MAELYFLRKQSKAFQSCRPLGGGRSADFCEKVLRLLIASIDLTPQVRTLGKAAKALTAPSGLQGGPSGAVKSGAAQLWVCGALLRALGQRLSPSLGAAWVTFPMVFPHISHSASLYR